MAPHAESRHLRIAHIISTGGLYGAEQIMLELAEYSLERHHEAEIVIVDGGGAAAVAAAARARGLRADILCETPSGGLRCARRLRAHLKARQPAVVHSHGYKPDILLPAIMANRHSVCIATCHNWISDTRRVRVWEALDRLALRTFDHVIAVSSRVRAALIKSGCQPANVSVIPNGVDFIASEPASRHQVRAEFNIPANAQMVVQVGRLEPNKGSRQLLDAISRLPERLKPYIVFVGDGHAAFVASLHDQAKALLLSERIAFAGYRSDVARLLSAADLMVIPSLNEGLPVVLLEAMATNCPIVTTAVGAIPEVLVDGQDGWLVQPGDVPQLTRAITSALTDGTEAARRAHCAYRKYIDNHSRAAMGRRYDEIYASCVANLRTGQRGD